MPWWETLAIVAAVLLVTAVVARVLDRRIARSDLRASAATRYRVLRRTITTIIWIVGILSALLVIPQVRAVAGGLLASTAVIGLVIGFAARSTLANWVAGLMIAITQPLRLGDTIVMDGTRGTVEEIGLSYTVIRMHDNDRLVIPNEKLASDTIRNSTIVSRKKLAEVTVQVPLDNDLAAVVAALRDAAGDDPEAEVLVTDLAGNATVALRSWAADVDAAAELEGRLRLELHEQLRKRGVFV
jgi:small-conductance mechanosensitive channel